MTRNLSPFERDLRAAVLAPLGLLLTFVFGIASVAGIFALVFATMMLVTSLTGYCPMTALFDTDPTLSV